VRRVAGTRRDIDTLSDAELSDYIHALDVLRQRSPTPLWAAFGPRQIPKCSK